ncbi:MAG: efflux RND transporter periplasmic adaptor subunit [Deltaproteobacteria bacterium]
MASADLVTVYAYGIVEARHHSTLSAKFPGKLEKIYVKEGDRVKSGQLLAQFEARELEAQVRVAKAAAGVARAELAEAEAGTRPQEIEAAREQLQDAEAQRRKAAADWDRYQDLHKAATVSDSDWEKFRLKLESTEARRNEAAQQLHLLEEGTRSEAIAVLRQRLVLALAQVDQAEAVLDNSRLTAPYDGVITRKHREEGEAMDIGLPVMDIATLEDRYIRAEIDETDIGRVKVGMPAQVTADGFPNLRFDGEVKEIKQQMGPKKLIPSDPSKIIDYKVLDVEVSLPQDCPFPIKLPVNVRISPR